MQSILVDAAELLGLAPGDRVVVGRFAGEPVEVRSWRSSSPSTASTSCGATPAQLGVTAAVEALLVAVPAVVLGPWLGTRVVELVERWGPLAQTGLELEPAISTAARLAAVAVIGIVTWPAVRSARGCARAQAARARPEGALPLQRTGIDVVVATHDLSIIDDADRRIELQDGQVVSRAGN